MALEENYVHEPQEETKTSDNKLPELWSPAREAVFLYQHDKLDLGKVVVLKVKEVPNGNLEVKLSYDDKNFTAFIKMLDDLSEQKCQNLEWLLTSEFSGKYNSELLGKIIEVPQQPA